MDRKARMAIELLFIILSLMLLFAGAEALVRGSSSLAMKAGLSPLVIGLTVVAYGTSAPELVVSLKSAISGNGDIAIGNVVGSNIFNIGIILGLTALICPIPVQLQLIKADVPVMIGLAIFLPFLLRDSWLTRFEGGVLLGAAILYTAVNVILSRRKAAKAVELEFSEGIPNPTANVFFDLLFVVGGLVVLVLGSNLLVAHSLTIARSLNFSEAIIGLTLIAAGTSVPELATSCVAAIRKQPDIAIGNVVGSNIFNVSGILGTASLAGSFQGSGIHAFDLAVMIGFSIVLLPMLWSGVKLQRLEGGLLMAAYVGYIYMLWPK